MAKHFLDVQTGLEALIDTMFFVGLRTLVVLTDFK